MMRLPRSLLKYTFTKRLPSTDQRGFTVQAKAKTPLSHGLGPHADLGVTDSADCDTECSVAPPWPTYAWKNPSVVGWAILPIC